MNVSHTDHAWPGCLFMVQMGQPALTLNCEKNGCIVHMMSVLKNNSDSCNIWEGNYLEVLVVCWELACSYHK